MFWRTKACRKANRSMETYVSGGLDPAQEEALTAHLEDCEVCRECLERMLRGEAEIQTYFRDHVHGVEPAPEFWSVLERRLQKKGSPRAAGRWKLHQPRGFSWRVWVPAGAIVAMLAIWGSEIRFNPGSDGGPDLSARVQEKRELAQIRASLVDMEAELDAFDGVR